MLARAAQRMTIRDDEDLAVTQLPTRPAAGRPDDEELRRAVPPIPSALPRRGPPCRRRRRRAARAAAAAAELDKLAGRRAELPLRALRELDAVDQELAQVRGQRSDVAERLATLPAPGSTVLGRAKDAHAAERARLAAALDGAGRHLAALDTTRERLMAANPGLPAARTSPRRSIDARSAAARGARAP